MNIMYLKFIIGFAFYTRSLGMLPLSDYFFVNCFVLETYAVRRYANIGDTAEPLPYSVTFKIDDRFVNNTQRVKLEGIFKKERFTIKLIKHFFHGTRLCMQVNSLHYLPPPPPTHTHESIARQKRTLSERS